MSEQQLKAKLMDAPAMQRALSRMAHEILEQLDPPENIVLVGIKRTQPFYEGLLEEGFNADDILRVNTLAEASDFIAKTTRPGDVVLFENDLPDNYKE